MGIVCFSVTITCRRLCRRLKTSIHLAKCGINAGVHLKVCERCHSTAVELLYNNLHILVCSYAMDSISVNEAKNYSGILEITVQLYCPTWKLLENQNDKLLNKCINTCKII